jgi:hypothetical protein
MSECSICYEAVIDFPAPPGAEATGSHRSSCGHSFHPKCISKWHSTQQISNCPMCRKEAVYMEDCAPSIDSDDESEQDEGEYFDHGGAIRITRMSMDYLLRRYSGIGVNAGVEAEIDFGGYAPGDETTITRHEFQRILAEQGGAELSDAQWSQLMTVYPAVDDEDAVVGGSMALVTPPAQLAMTLSPEEHDMLHAAFTGEGGAWELTSHPTEEVVHAPGPFDYVQQPPESPRVILSRESIHSLLQAHGSTATMEEFFNEEGGHEETLVVTMTLESLNLRFAGLGATPVTLTEAIAPTSNGETLEITSYEGGVSEVVVKEHIILNPEDDPEMGPIM